MNLAQCTDSRDNNFNLIRLLAALCVLITHSFALSIGTAEAEPLRGRLGMTIGNIAVDVFFVTSGFLVTASLLRRESGWTFLKARCLRIYPGLVVMAFLTTYIMGSALTLLPLDVYLLNPETHFYFLKSASLVSGVGWVLPGVFKQNPFREIVNGSLWTLPYEIGMYASLLLSWLLLRRWLPKGNSAFTKFALAVLVISVPCLYLSKLIVPNWLNLARLTFMFYTGAVIYIFRARIKLSLWPVCFAGILALISILTRNTSLLFIVYSASLAYTIFYFAYVPTGRIRMFNRVGDYSYGVYIYAFPVQQIIANLLSPISPWPMVALSGIVTLMLAVISWHVVEKRFLRLK